MTQRQVTPSCGSRRLSSWAGWRVCSTASRRRCSPSRWLLGRSWSRCGERYPRVPCHPPRRSRKVAARAPAECTSERLSSRRLNPIRHSGPMAGASRLASRPRSGFGRARTGTPIQRILRGRAARRDSSPSPPGRREILMSTGAWIIIVIVIIVILAVLAFVLMNRRATARRARAEKIRQEATERARRARSQRG